MDELRLKLAVMHNVAPVQLNYQKTVALLYALKAGSVKLEQVVLDGDNWQLVEVKIEAPESEPKESPEG